MGYGDGMSIVVLSIFAALILILLVVLIAVAFKIIETLKKLDLIIDDITAKSKKLDGVFDIVDNTSNMMSGISGRIIEAIVIFVQNFLDRKRKKED